MKTLIALLSGLFLFLFMPYSHASPAPPGKRVTNYDHVYMTVDRAVTLTVNVLFEPGILPERYIYWRERQCFTVVYKIGEPKTKQGKTQLRYLPKLC